MTTASTRDSFQSRYGLIIACIGSAVGMANIWLFPYRVGELGGGAFLVPYFLCVALIGYVGIVAEMSFGRSMQTGPLGAFTFATRRRGNESGAWIGWIPVLGSLGIAIGYSIVIGWILRFLIGSLTGSMIGAEHSEAYFGAIIGPFGSLFWHLSALGITLIVMLGGIASGIERFNKYLMPLFFILFIILAIRVAFLPGAAAGYRFMFTPDWSAIFQVKTWVYALGQAFFSLSLAGSGSVVYGSYIKRDVDIPKSAAYVAVFDTLAALLAALVILPAVFAYGIAPNAGPPLMFITMPDVFRSMPLGGLFAIIFFFAVLLAGLTSLVNLLETPIEALQHRFQLSRLRATLIIGAITAGVGIFIEQVDRLSLWMDVISIYIIPIGALLAAIMFFWVCGKSFVLQEVSLGRPRPVMEAYYHYGKWVFCGVTLGVYLLGIVYGGIG